MSELDTQRMTKEQLMKDIRESHGNLETTLSKLTPTQMEMPGVTKGTWSVKDILIHIAIWEQRLTTWLRASILGEQPEFLPSGVTWQNLEEWNQQTYAEHKDRTLQEGRAMFNQAYADMWQMIESIPGGELFIPDRFLWRKGRPLWRLVEMNTTLHYRENDETIREWMGALEN